MEFGSLPDISGVDFTLPPDKEETGIVLKRAKPLKNPRIYVGCPIWTHPAWVGKIFPPKTKPKDFLYFYSRQFNAIELNATFYRMPPVSTIENWASSVPDTFRFCPKIPQQISRFGMTKNNEAGIENFRESALAFGNKLGICFLQLAPNFGSDKMDSLQRFLSAFPKDIPLAVELRHASWFNDLQTFHEIFDFMEENGNSAVITDVPGRRDVLHQRLTTSTAFIRFNGNDLHPTDFTRLDDWVNRIKSWIEKGLHDLYFFMHTEDKSLNPELSNYFIDKLNEACGLDLAKAEFVKAHSAKIPKTKK
jgi:uncharacterized protein YecE (DUF72 family)